jgi:hypothetical protein
MILKRNKLFSTHLCDAMASTGTHYSHRGILQLALGPVARGDNAGFKFNKELKTWTANISDFVTYYAGTEDIDEDDIDEDYVHDLLMMAIDKGAENTPDNAGLFRGSGGGYGRQD